ncbi:serine/threonine-protein kinase [Pseudonocardia sp.]|uniref:serine/threonine-protein kinase n=1 Tax=Pseudonocardia sp. TaxID=60912 RepID=UPI0026079531|nr:serine/threonine-protein kinase [Pseudonocardia sp.]
MEQFGRYRLEELVGRGGMGEVYRAVDTVHDRVVALKRLPAHLASDEEFRARFRKEATVASRLTEPHIVPIHDFGEIDGRLYLDMRLVTGRDLAAVLAAEGPLAPARAVSIVAQVASALDAAHGSGLLHRDVKPANVLVTGTPGGEFAYLADFGIARAVDGSGDAALTATGATVGTLGYMAPERFLGDRVDHRADVYALACVLVELLTGQLPFAGTGPALMHAHMAAEPPAPSRLRAQVPAGLDEVVARGMAKRPDNRYASAGAFAAAATQAVAPVAVGAAPDLHTVVPLRGAFGAPPAPSGPTPYATHVPTAYPPTAHAPYPAPPARGPAAPAAPSPRRWPLLTAAAAAAVALGVAAAVAPWPGETITEPPPGGGVVVTGSSGTTATAEPDPTAALLARINGDGYVESSCTQATTTDGAVAQVDCDTTDPAVPAVVFQQFGDTATYDASLLAVANGTTGEPVDCASGGASQETFAGYDLSCGWTTLADGTGVYVIAWGSPTSQVQGLVGGVDPAAVWNWWLVHTPF